MRSEAGQRFARVQPLAKQLSGRMSRDTGTAGNVATASRDGFESQGLTANTVARQAGSSKLSHVLSACCMRLRRVCVCTIIAHVMSGRLAHWYSAGAQRSYAIFCLLDDSPGPTSQCGNLPLIRLYPASLPAGCTPSSRPARLTTSITPLAEPRRLCMHTSCPYAAAAG